MEPPSSPRAEPPDDSAGAIPDHRIVTLEFEVNADDLHAVGRTLYLGRRNPTLIWALTFAGAGAVFWWLGNPVGGVVARAFAVVIFTNPRFLNRLMAQRMPGNRIGSRWRYEIGPYGIAVASDGFSGRIEWVGVRSAIIGSEAIVVIGSHESLLASIPRRATTPSEVSAIVDLIATFAPAARVIQ